MQIAIIILILVIILAAVIILTLFLLGVKRGGRRNVDIHMSGGADIRRGFISSDNNYFKGLSGDLENTLVLNSDMRVYAPGDAKNIRLVNLVTTKGYNISLHPQIIIGRAPVDGAFTVSDDAAVSKRHCRLYCHNDEVYIEDLGSMNHTFVNGERIIAATRLMSGDTVRVGNTEYRIFI